MSRGMGSLTCLFLIGSLFHVVAIDHKVGGDFGWNLPPTLTFYSEWARNNTFFIDDTLSNYILNVLLLIIFIYFNYFDGLFGNIHFSFVVV